MDVRTLVGPRLAWNVARYASSERSDRWLPHALLVERDDRTRVSSVEEAHMVCSRDARGKHWPVIDLDIPHRVVPSSTPGHGHLYLDVQMSWFRYVVLLFALRFAGVIGPGFLWWSLARGATFARLPGVNKDVSIGLLNKKGVSHAL